MRKPDDVHARWTGLAPVDLANCRGVGVPEEAIDDTTGTIDVDMLRERGWHVASNELRPPANTNT